MLRPIGRSIGGYVVLSGLTSNMVSSCGYQLIDNLVRLFDPLWCQNNNIYIFCKLVLLDKTGFDGVSFRIWMGFVVFECLMLLLAELAM